MKRRVKLTKAFARRVYSAYQKDRLTAPQTAARFGGGSPKRVKLDLIRQMHADYQTMSLAAVGRKYKRCGMQVRELFVSRGFSVRPFKATPYNPKNGQILPIVPKTPKQLAAIIARQTKICIPEELRHEWRHWPLAKRGRFVARLRARIKPERDRPQTLFSKNVEPFDYGSPRAHAILAKLNKGLSSRDWKVKIDLCTQGVIYRGELWFWSPKTGYERGPWTREHGRPLLHRVIFEESTGKKLTSSDVVRFADGNPNNLSPRNLILATKNDVARETQAKWLLRRSREKTAVLLQRSQRKENHGLIEVLSKAA